MRSLDLPGDTDVALAQRLFSAFAEQAGVKNLEKQKQRVRALRGSVCARSVLEPDTERGCPTLRVQINYEQYVRGMAVISAGRPLEKWACAYARSIGALAPRRRSRGSCVPAFS